MDQPCLICGQNHNNLPCPKLRDGLLYDPIPRLDLQLPPPAGFYTKSQLDEAVREAVEAEREECAKVADRLAAKAKSRANDDDIDGKDFEEGVVFGTEQSAVFIARAIRARGETK